MNMYKDFELFTRALIETKDVDPIYSFIKELMKEFKYTTREEKQWFVLCYTSFYSLESAIKMSQYLPFGHWNEKEFIELRQSGEINKFGHERRGNVRTIGNQIKMIEKIINKIDKDDWDYSSNLKFRYNVMDTLPMHGEWSSYKIAEVFEKALNYNTLGILDLGIDGKDVDSNDGPIGGLKWLFGRDNVYSDDIKPVWNMFGVLLAMEWYADVGEVESALCKWHKMMTGNYYVGHDIHELAELRDNPLPVAMYNRIMCRSFPVSLWKGIDGILKKNKKVYKETGKILGAEFATNKSEIDVYEVLMKCL